MKQHLNVSADAAEIVEDLQRAGFEAYIVGGAVRDLLLGRSPKDFDVSCSATPEEVRAVFGRRFTRIIGKRFRLSHVFRNGELYEVSTFRQAPAKQEPKDGRDHWGENLIVSDNSFGTAEEDAWRRDFTVNALFYDPVKEEILDLTGQGLADIRDHLVRAIGEPALRFEEDPVRLLRALKLVAQFDFALENRTENALFCKLPCMKLASASRLTLELEKILQSCYNDRHLQVFHDYGLLQYFLPEIHEAWGRPETEYAIDLLYERNCRVEERCYRNSVSLAMAALALPFVELALGREPGTLWEHSPEATETIRRVLGSLFRPLTPMIRMTLSAEHILTLQPALEEGFRPQLLRQRGFSHARELYFIRHAAAGEDLAPLEQVWGESREIRERRPEKEGSRYPKKRRPVRHGRPGPR